LKQNNDKSYKNYSHEFTLHSCIQYARPIALSKVLFPFHCLVMYTAMVTDIDHRTSLIHFYNTYSALCSYTVAILVTETIHTQYAICTMAQLNMLSLYSCPLALYAIICTSKMLYSLPVSPIPLQYGSICLSASCSWRGWHRGKSGGLTSGASSVTMLLSAAAFCDNINSSW